MFYQEHNKKKKKTFRGRWSQAQHNRFMRGLQKYGKDWNSIENVVKSRNYSQIRSHAQKVFLKMEKRDIQAYFQKEEQDDEIKFFQNQKYKRISKKQGRKNILSEQPTKIKQQKKKLFFQNIKIEQLQQNQKHKNQIIFKEIQEETSFFTKILLNNYEYFARGGNFLNINNNQKTLGVKLFTQEIEQQKKIQ